MEFCLHRNWVLADDDTGRKNGRMGGLRAEHSYQRGSFNQARVCRLGGLVLSIAIPSQ